MRKQETATAGPTLEGCCTTIILIPRIEFYRCATRHQETPDKKRRLPGPPWRGVARPYRTPARHKCYSGGVRSGGYYHYTWQRVAKCKYSNSCIFRERTKYTKYTNPAYS